jgi:hypothetical protein
MNNPAGEISQAERRRILAEERRAKTYMGRTNLDAELELGGRFSEVHSTTVVGSGPISYPQQPKGSPWHSEPVPNEAPLGFAIDQMEPVGEKFEVAASDTSTPPSQEQASHVTVADDAEGGRVAPSKFKRGPSNNGDEHEYQR